MEASIRLLSCSNRHHVPTSLLLKLTHKPLPLSPSSFRPPSLSFSPKTTPRIFLSHHNCSSSSPFRFSNHPFTSPFFNPILSSNRFARIVSGPQERLFNWHFAAGSEDGVEIGAPPKDGPIVTVVLLGWLGSEPKHLRRDVLSFDLGKKLEERIGVLANELALWLSQSDEDDRERYGAILENLKSREDFLKKIKGCVVDSGGDPNISTKVWAAGFTAALLKKRSSSAYPSVEAVEGFEVGNGLTSGNVQLKEPMLIETLLLAAFEKFFSFILNLPHVNERLRKVISMLTKNQPSCPQLYLYSSADKVIPAESVESFVEEQRKSGKKVQSFNFGSSPHVDHYRTFPAIYVSVLQKFLEECMLIPNQVYKVEGRS